MAVPAAGTASVDDTYVFGGNTYVIVDTRDDGSYISHRVENGGLTGDDVATLYESVDGVNRYTDTEKSKLSNTPDAARIVTSPAMDNLKIRVLTQAEYDALSPDSSTLYFIKE